MEFDTIKPTNVNFKQGNIAIIVDLQENKSNFHIAVANTHLYYLETAEDVRFGQMSCLLNKLSKWQNERELAGVVLCGDLNALPDSLTIKRIYNEKILSTGLPAEIAENIDYFLSLFPEQIKLRSAYENYQFLINNQQNFSKQDKSGHPEFTYYVPNSPATLDYIFYSEK